MFGLSKGEVTLMILKIYELKHKNAFRVQSQNYEVTKIDPIEKPVLLTHFTLASTLHAFFKVTSICWLV